MVNFLNQHMALILSILYNLALSIGILVASGTVAHITLLSLEKAVHKIKGLDDTFLPTVSFITKYTIYGIGCLFILNLFGVNTASIVTLMGAIGLAIGFALKDTLANIAAGLMLLVLRPFKNGDYIETKDTSGTVKELDLFVTILETPDGLFISVPNSVLWGAPIKNYSRNRKRRIEIEIGISYNDSVDVAFEVMRQIIQEDKRFLSDPVPQYLLKKFGDSSVDLGLRAWTKTSEYWEVYWDTNKKIKKAFDEKGITIPFPQRDIHIFNETLPVQNKK